MLSIIWRAQYQAKKLNFILIFSSSKWIVRSNTKMAALNASNWTTLWTSNRSPGSRLVQLSTEWRKSHPANERCLITYSNKKCSENVEPELQNVHKCHKQLYPFYRLYLCLLKYEYLNAAKQYCLRANYVLSSLKLISNTSEFNLFQISIVHF